MPKKIGKDTLNLRAPVPFNESSEGLLSKKWRNETSSREKVLAVLKEAKGRLSINQISRKADISWTTTRNALKELLLLGLVEGERVGITIYFKLKHSEAKTTTSKNTPQEPEEFVPEELIEEVK